MKSRSGSHIFYRGQLAEVCSETEIRATLDADGKLDGVPFMPEMIRHCGRRFRVARRADKTCVEGYGVRSMHSTVFLENLRCDGAAHDGCQRNCLIFWKEAWLKPVDNDGSAESAEQRFAIPPPSRPWGRWTGGGGHLEALPSLLCVRRLSRRA